MSSAGEIAAPAGVPGPAIVVLGLGEESRSEDRAGLEVVRRLRAGPPIAAELLEWHGDLAALIDRWAGWETVIVVDAVRSGAPVGSVGRWRVRRAADLASPLGSTSTHGFTLAHAIGLGEALGQLPRTLIVVGVEVSDLGPGARLSPAVEAGIRSAVESVRQEIAGRTSGDVREDSVDA